MRATWLSSLNRVYRQLHNRTRQLQLFAALQTPEISTEEAPRCNFLSLWQRLLMCWTLFMHISKGTGPLSPVWRIPSRFLLPNNMPRDVTTIGKRGGRKRAPRDVHFPAKVGPRGGKVRGYSLEPDDPRLAGVTLPPQTPIRRRKRVGGVLVPLPSLNTAVR